MNTSDDGRSGRAGLPRRSDRRGLVLIACVGVLGVISVMGFAFATVMRLEARAARNYTESVRAEFVARAGIEDAIARLRIMARGGGELPYEGGKAADWYTWRGTGGQGGEKISYPAWTSTNAYDDDDDDRIDDADSDAVGGEIGDNDRELGYTDWLANSYSGGDNYTLKIVDAASKINVNAGDNLGTILDNLCRVIGPPLRAADQRALVPRWFSEARCYKGYANRLNGDDKETIRDLFYRLGIDKRPICESYGGDVGRGPAVYGDGYAIAGYRATHGVFLSIEDVRHALTWIERGDGDGDGDMPLIGGPRVPEPDRADEMMEVEAKFAAIRPYITIDSWWDTDQVGYGKFEHIRVRNGRAFALTDRNKTWTVRRNLVSENPGGLLPDTNHIDGKWYAGELKGSFIAIVNGVGQGQFKTITGNSIDTLYFDNTRHPESEFVVPPNRYSSYIIVGKDGFTSDMDGDLDIDQIDFGKWREQLKLYSRQPLSIHRAPVNVNTARGKVLVSLLMGLQTTWGMAGYGTKGKNIADWGGWLSADLEWAHFWWMCPSVVSLGRDDNNAYLRFHRDCPNKNCSGGCFFCVYGHMDDRASTQSKRGGVNEAHDLAWQILKEREQTEGQDCPAAGDTFANGHGPFKGWDELFFRVLWPVETGSRAEMHFPIGRGGGRAAYMGKRVNMNYGGAERDTRLHPGLARLCMANFNSNTDLLKFQPNLEWIDRWGPNFTDLYCPWPDLLNKGADVKLRIRPGELLDKSDLNVGTTEFCFDSKGVYEIESVGRVYDAKRVVAERKLAALVRIYDVWRESTQREFAAGRINKAQGKVPGKFDSGQVTADQVRYDFGSTPPRWTTGPDERKCLVTWPEPLMPFGYRTGAGHLAAFAVGNFSTTAIKEQNRGAGVIPASYDGQITLATNCYRTTRTTDLPPDDGAGVLLYAGFSGDLDADFSQGNKAEPTLHEEGAFSLVRQPLDEVSVLGKLNTEEVDLPKTTTVGGYHEGEGKGGDLRPDGCFFGVVGSQVLDGAIEYDPVNLYYVHGAITMWAKPLWHHGTRMPASLPVGYDPYAGDERGSTVCMKAYGGDYPQTGIGGTQEYDSPTDRTTKGYVRDRFEHEFFNGGNWATGLTPKAFRLVKLGDDANSGIDGDCPGFGTWNGGNQRSIGPFGALIDDIENGPDQDDLCYLPGWLDRMDKGGRPFYQICPFRWFYLGFTFNQHYGEGVPWARQSGECVPATWDSNGNNDGHHGLYGQPTEREHKSGVFVVTEGTRRADKYKHLAYVMQNRCFIDTMFGRSSTDGGSRGWGWYPQAWVPTGGAMSPEEMMQENLEDWAWAQYGEMCEWESGYPLACDGGNAFNKAFHYQEFGINRARPGGLHAYQKLFSGTYATIDEYKVFKYFPDVWNDFKWPYLQRRAGRYYFERDRNVIEGRYADALARDRSPCFWSQSLLESETRQNYTFAPGEEDQEVELCTVRWTVFTPFYCLDDGSFSPIERGGIWKFPYDTYFYDWRGLDRFKETFRYSPHQYKLLAKSAGFLGNKEVKALWKVAEWKKDLTKGVASRFSSQRGCRVQVQAEGRTYPSSVGYYEDPEAWSQIIDNPATGQHARCTPNRLIYKVQFRFSELEYKQAGKMDTCLLDTPVLDDVTISYMRRPKILQWRDVTE